MNPFKQSSFFSSLFVFLILFSSSSSSGTPLEQFFRCLSGKSPDNAGILSVVFIPTNPSYKSILESRIQNLRFNTTDTPKPLAIVTPLSISQVQDTVVCAREYNVQIRIRSGGHDYEGLSYVSYVPFVMLDLINIRNISVDVKNKIAWVECGANLGELYYSISQKSRTLAFPAGTFPTVGVGGLFTGGGFGYLLRKFGLAADNIVDALIVDVNGKVLDRASMGEDLFWAIRGGGGNTFGVVISFKINLVPVPRTVTRFSVRRSADQNTIKLLYRWQFVATKLPDEISLYAAVRNQNSTRFAMFDALYLGRIDTLLPLMEERFPELGLTRQDCEETSWIQAQLTLAGYSSNTSTSVLLSRINMDLNKFKSKSDYIKEPIPEAAFEYLVKWIFNERINNSFFYGVPYGGKMGEIAETSLPFPHRAGNLYMMTYEVQWYEEGREIAEYNINWVRKIYSYMAQYVSKNPRAAYFNYRDLDIGTNNLIGNTSYRQASVWGRKYFKNNFERLVRVKTAFDPSNFFRNEQSIPPFSR